MREEYDKLNVTIGRVTAQVTVSESFPVIGSEVRLSALTRWARRYVFATDPGNGGGTVSGVPDRQRAETAIVIKSAGDLKQSFKAENGISSIEVVKNLYALDTKEDPYFSITCDKEIIRTDGESARIVITGDNGYDLGREHQVAINVFRENEEGSPVISLTELARGTHGGKICLYADIALDTRGIYDVEVTLADIGTGQSRVKRSGKLITVPPALAPRERAIELVIPTGDEQNAWYPMIDLSVYPPGTTIILRDDPGLPEGYKRRLFIRNAKGTFESPIIITIDQDPPYHIPFVSYNGINVSHCEHVVFDGRGYRNISKGIHVHPYGEEWGETAVIAPDGTNETEFFEMELSNTMFSGFVCKTEAQPERPEYWYGNFEYNRLSIHHCHIHDTNGEGAYLGYFDAGEITGVNSAGEEVTFRPHSMENTRIYRNDWINIGYDAIQLNNARNSEICHNNIENAGWRNEADQASGISLSLQGRIYNNVIRNFCGPGIQVAPFGELEIFNNIISGTQDGSMALLFLFDNHIPEHAVEEDINTGIPIYVHNNVLVGRKTCVSARNTVQFRSVFIDDNLMLYKTGLLGGQTDETLEVWRSLMRCNETRQYNEVDFADLDTLKIADSANGDFRISYDSPLMRAGYGLRFKFDFNGYRPWYSDTYPVGPFQGICVDPAYEEVPLALTRLIINNGETETDNLVLSLTLDFTGKAYQYRAGESESLSGVSWKDITPRNNYTLDGGNGRRRIYAQVRGARTESDIVSSVIEYVHGATVLTGIIINGGDGTSISGRLSVRISFERQRPDLYMISETGDFEEGEWLAFDDTVEYWVTGVSRTVTLFAKVKTDGVESGVVNASIDYIATIQYKEITLRIPLSELTGDVANIRAVIPNLKYGKRFALSWTMDDTLVYVYSRLFKYINKKWVDDSKIFHDGMPPTTGIMPDRYLCYTDGCGRDVRFCLNSAFVSHLNGKTPVLDYSFSGSQYFHLGEMERFIDYGNGIQNHGAGGYNDQGAAEAIRICNEEALTKLGFTPFLLLFPGEQDATMFAGAGEASNDVYQMSSGKKDSELSLQDLTDSFFKNKRSFMNRLTYDAFDLEGLKAKADYAFDQDNSFLMNFGGHNIEMDNAKFLDWETEMMPFLDYLYDTYGKGGDDSIWFAPLEEIYEYIFARHFSSVSVDDDGTDLIVSAKIAGMRNFRRRDLSLKLSGIDFSGVGTIRTDVDTYYMGSGLQADGTLLVNIDMDGNLVALAEKYVTAFETSPSQDSLEDAKYMVSRLRAELRNPYEDRIDTMNKPFGLRSVLINDGNIETSRREVGVTIIYDGFVAPSAYRLGENTDLEGIGWDVYTSGIRYILSEGLGTKNVYCQIKAPNGTLSEIRSTSIKLVEAGARVAIVSIGWGADKIPNTTPGYSIFDNGITRFQSQTSTGYRRIIYDQEGEMFRTAVPSSISVMMQSTIPGSITGDDSGIYPDEYLRHNSICGGNSAKNEHISFTLPVGAYRVSLLLNTSWSQKRIPNDALAYRAVTDTNEVPIVPPESGVQENTSHMTIPVEVTVGDTGLLRVEFGLNGLTSTFYYAPLNVIKIEKVK